MVYKKEIYADGTMPDFNIGPALGAPLRNKSLNVPVSATAPLWAPDPALSFAMPSTPVRVHAAHIPRADHRHHQENTHVQTIGEVTCGKS